MKTYAELERAAYMAAYAANDFNLNLLQSLIEMESEIDALNVEIDQLKNDLIAKDKELSK